MRLNISVNFSNICKIRIHIKISDALGGLKNSFALGTYSITNLTIKIILKVSDLFLSV